MALRVDDVDLGRDRALVERYQSGDDSAFEDLYTRYFGRLHRYCTRRVHDADTAEEIAQEAFVRALQALPHLEGDRRFYPWMTVIASRLCVDHHRDRQRTHPSDTVDLGTVEPDVAHVFTAVDHAHLTEALGRINPRHRRVLELREREGLPYDAIADRMDVTLGAVEALLHRARKALRREFLAVSGDGRLAGVPVLGWLLHRLGRVRHRMPMLSDAANSLAFGMASAAMVIAPASGGHLFGSDPGAPGTTGGTEVAADPASHHVDLARSLDGDFGDGALGTGSDAGDGSTRSPASSHTVAYVKSPQVGLGASGEEKPEGTTEEEVDGGPVKVGVSPSQIADDVVEEATDFLEKQ